ncbi:MAG: ATP-binding protein [Caldilineaceae bacterium SB0662_bin_9]|uniref:ATP-binding protein n=1 Tax=Caldilineaceae bacterium SB0662_bin_9 TaxID=2605258 RepID=A0A6B1DVT5_9CHLR|nr:ATP-binding protein [Caldilineaceae bacterium SB0662_bin_9]
MPRPGGEADKLGNRYESLWTVDAVLDLIDCEYRDLTVEAVGDEAAGVEFVRTTQEGIREYHSIKRQHARGNWTFYELAREDVLNDLIVKTGTGSHAVFSSGTSATEFEELTECARASDTFEEFKQRIGRSRRISGQFVKYIAPLCEDERAAWIALQRLYVRTTNEPQLTKNVERRVRLMFQTTTEKPIDPRVVRLLIGDVLTDSLGKRHNAESILAALEEHKILLQQWAGDMTVGEHIGKLNHSHLAGVKAHFINREEIVRDESAMVATALLEHSKSVMLEGIAGSGKSCVLAQLIDYLDNQGVPCLVLRLDQLDSSDRRAQAIGFRLGLPASPAISLGRFAGNQPSVLVVDQLDAISVVSARNQAAWSAVNELLDEVNAYPQMRILFACRSFDLERDPQIRRLADDPERVERITVGSLNEGVIRSAIESAGLDLASLNQRQMEILSTPLHLYLLLESAKSSNSRSMGFASSRDLFNEFWEHKGSAFAYQMGGDLDVWPAVIGRLCDELSESETLVAPSYALDEYGKARSILASEGIVYVQDDNIRFFHESFFDYAFARAFVRSREDLIQWLLSGEQHLFRRSQVRQVLEFLRGHATNGTRYRQTLRNILSHPGIRFHIKKLVLDWLGALPDPTPAEWHIVERLEENLGNHTWNVVRNSVPWFDILQDLGCWQVWLESDNERIIDRTLGLLRMSTVLDARSDVIVGLVREARDASENWKARLRGLIGGRHGYTSPEMHDLVVELVGDGTLDQIHPGIEANTNWWFMWHGLGTEQPEFAIRILGAWFDRQIESAAELGESDPFADHMELVTYSQNSGDLIRECAEAAPLQFVTVLFPRLAQFDRRVPKEWVDAPGHTYSPDDQLREALGDAMCTVASENPAALDAIVETEPLGESTWMSMLLLRAWSANPEAYAERIAQYIMESPDRRLTLTYSSSVGITDFAAVIHTAVAAASAECSDEPFASLESAIMALAPDREHRYREFGLLRALDKTRLSTKAHRRLQELERRFPEALQHSARQPSTDDGFGWVDSPIPQMAQSLMTDDQWLRAMEKYGNDEESSGIGSRISGGAWELSRGLEALVRDNPDRFSRLANRMGASLNPHYFAAILHGLTRGERGQNSDWTGTSEQICSVLHRIADIKANVSARDIVNAIAALAAGDVPQDIIQTLCHIACSAKDPEKDSWSSSPIGPIGQAINSDRGSAASTIADLLAADGNRWSILKSTVEQLVIDPVLAVRSVTARCLLAILDTHREDALAGFQRLIEDADPILGSRWIERFVHYAMFRDYAAMRPTLMKMLQSSEPATITAGARQITLAGLSLDEARDDADLVLSMGEEERATAAEIYANNVTHATVGPECEERLKVLFKDESDAVRRSAARCWSAFEPDELAQRGSLLGAFVASIGPEDDINVLVYTLEQSHERLPSEVCALAERAVTAYGPKGADFRLREAGAATMLTPLIIRLHEETEDPELRRRVLNVIDTMLRVGFIGMNDQLEKHYARS